jgi:hypothetical protein
LPLRTRPAVDRRLQIGELLRIEISEAADDAIGDSAHVALVEREAVLRGDMFCGEQEARGARLVGADVDLPPASMT